MLLTYSSLYLLFILISKGFKVVMSNAIQKSESFNFIKINVHRTFFENMLKCKLTKSSNFSQCFSLLGVLSWVCFAVYFLFKFDTFVYLFLYLIRQSQSLLFLSTQPLDKTIKKYHRTYLIMNFSFVIDFGF